MPEYLIRYENEKKKFSGVKTLALTTGLGHRVQLTTLVYNTMHYSSDYTGNILPKVIILFTPRGFYVNIFEGMMLSHLLFNNRFIFQ